MRAIKVGVREFRERIASFLESDKPVAVTRCGETVGVYIPTLSKKPKEAEVTELRAAATRLAELLADVDEEEIITEFKQLRRRATKTKQLVRKTRREKPVAEVAPASPSRKRRRLGSMSGTVKILSDIVSPVI